MKVENEASTLGDGQRLRVLRRFIFASTLMAIGFIATNVLLTLAGYSQGVDSIKLLGGSLTLILAYTFRWI